MECLNCGSERILSISAKCSDCCNLQFMGEEHQGYVPSDLSIGGGDYIELDICLACGMSQGVSNEINPSF